MTAQLEAPQLIEHVHRSLTYTVYETMWVPRSARIVSLGTTARGSGMMQVLQLNKGRLEVVAETEKTDPFKSGSFAASPLHERHLATGQFKGQVSIWCVACAAARAGGLTDPAPPRRFAGISSGSTRRCTLPRRRTR